jgi:hypothetical protein
MELHSSNTHNNNNNKINTKIFSAYTNTAQKIPT